MIFFLCQISIRNLEDYFSVGNRGARTHHRRACVHAEPTEHLAIVEPESLTFALGKTCQCGSKTAKYPVGQLWMCVLVVKMCERRM